MPDAAEQALLAGPDPWIDALGRWPNPPGPWGKPSFSIHERTGIRLRWRSTACGSCADAGFGRAARMRWPRSVVSWCRIKTRGDLCIGTGAHRCGDAIVPSPPRPTPGRGCASGAHAGRHQVHRASGRRIHIGWGVAPVLQPAGAMPIASLAGVTEEMVKMSFGCKG
ncbi:MAG: hypothetical protein R2851_20410 [Caldilineaceae bacterium]